MADVNSPSDALEWLNRVWGFLVGVIMTIVGLGTWISNKLNGVEARMDLMEKDLTNRAQVAATNIAVLQAYHQSNTHRLDSIEATTNKIDEKLDQVLQAMARNGRE